MVVPKSVVVGGVRMRIRYKKLASDAYGEYDHDLNEIRINSVLVTDETLFWETLRHEVLHASFGVSGISSLERFEEETVVRCIENVFFPAWKRICP